VPFVLGTLGTEMGVTPALPVTDRGVPVLAVGSGAGLGRGAATAVAVGRAGAAVVFEPPVPLPVGNRVVHDVNAWTDMANGRATSPGSVPGALPAAAAAGSGSDHCGSTDVVRRAPGAHRVAGPATVTGGTGAGGAGRRGRADRRGAVERCVDRWWAAGRGVRRAMAAANAAAWAASIVSAMSRAVSARD